MNEEKSMVQLMNISMNVINKNIYIKSFVNWQKNIDTRANKNITPPVF